MNHLFWPNAMETVLSQTLLSVIACPQCKGSLALQGNPPELVCSACQLAYAIVEGKPLLLVEKARKLS